MSDLDDETRKRYDNSRGTTPLVFQPAEGVKAHGLELVRQLRAGAFGEFWLAASEAYDLGESVAYDFDPEAYERLWTSAIQSSERGESYACICGCP
jgi:hypothetical protein